jgi:hypothetical protein
MPSSSLASLPFLHVTRVRGDWPTNLWPRMGRRPRRASPAGPGGRQPLVVAAVVLQACLAGALAVGLVAEAGGGLGGLGRGPGAAGGGVTMVLCKDKCESGCKIYRLPGLRIGLALSAV